MNRYSSLLYAALALFAAPTTANAQTVFFDDFDGNALLPHWGQGPPQCWDHSVSDGQLHVTGLFCPSASHPPVSANYHYIAAPFEAQSDFRMDVWMGWEAGQQPHRLRVLAASPSGSNLAWIGYMNEGLAGPQVFAGGSGGGYSPFIMPAPPPDIHHFTISRTGTQFNFYFNGLPFGSFQDIFGLPAASVVFEFLGPHPGTLGAFHIDRVVVVPGPGTLVLLVALSLCWPSNRRR